MASGIPEAMGVLSSLAQFMADGIADQLRIAVRSQLLHQTHLVRTDGFRAQMQFAGNDI